MTNRYQTPLHEIVANAPDLAASSREKYLRDIDAWIDYAGTSPSGWTRDRAQAFYNGLLTKISPQSANRLMSSVSYASRWWAHTANNPSLDFAIVRKASPGTAEARHSLTDDHALRLLNTTLKGSPQDLRDRAMIVLGLETGMRRMSIEAAMFENIKADPYPRILVPIKGHGESLFSVPLSDATLASLQSWKNSLVSMKAPSKSGAIFRRIWHGLDGKGHRKDAPRDTEALAAGTIHKIIVTRGQTAGLEDVHPHIFRHTFVTWRTESGMTDPQIASVTGHSLVARSGALGGYKDLMMIGGTARGFTPAWLTTWLHEVG